MMAVSLAVTFVLQEMDANSTHRIWGALDSFRSQFERGSDRNFVNVTPLQLGEEVLWIHCKLLVNGFRLGFGKEFLKTWIIADRIPDGVDLQPRNGNV